MTALPTLHERSSLPIPQTLEGPLTTATFQFGDLLCGDVCGRVNDAYNRELAQRGLTDLQVSGEANSPTLKWNDKTEIARPDLYLRVCEAVCRQSNVRMPILEFTTRSYFYILHAYNVQYSDNVRGKVNARYNELLLRNNVDMPLISGSNLEELGMDGYEGHQTTSLHTQWYVKAFADVVGGYDSFTQMPPMDADAFRVVFSHLPTVRELAPVRAVCRDWRTEAAHLDEPNTVISGTIEAEFPFHQIIGPQWWAELKAMPSRHPDSAGHPGETIGDFVARKREGLLVQADALAAQDPAKADRLRRRANGYRLDYEGAWTRAQVKSLYQMMGSVEVEHDRGCSIVLKPEDYDFEIHINILRATGVDDRIPGFVIQIGLPLELDLLRRDTPSGPATLTAITNGLVSETRDKTMDECDARVDALNCEVPELLNSMIHLHFIQFREVKTYTDVHNPKQPFNWTGFSWSCSLVQNSAGGYPWARYGGNMPGLLVYDNEGLGRGVGAQRKCLSIAR